MSLTLTLTLSLPQKAETVNPINETNPNADLDVIKRWFTLG